MPLAGNDKRAFLSAQRKAEDGKANCRVCSKEHAFDEVVAVVYGGSLVFAICLDCTADRNIIMERGPGGLHVNEQSRTIVSPLRGVGGLG